LQAQKKRVIVDEFDYSTVKTQVQAVFNTQQDIGKGIRAMLVKRIADANNLVVVERAKMDTLIKEQDFNLLQFRECTWRPKNLIHPSPTCVINIPVYCMLLFHKTTLVMRLPLE